MLSPHKKYLVVLSACCGLLLLLSACVVGTPERVVYRDQILESDTTWSGEILIDGSVKVGKQATLTILPGTRVLFVKKDLDVDGLGDGTLVVEGRFVALGTRQEPIVFRSAEESPQPGDWLEIRVDFSRDVQMRYCEVRDSAYTLHAHFTRGVVEDCWIHDNIDGCRLGQATFTFRNNLFEQNQGKGINFRNSRVEAHHNIIRNNGSGIFLFESDREYAIHHNNLYGNLDNFRLGDFYAGDVSLSNNWWGTSDPAEAARSIYDQKQDPAIGRVSINPSATWVEEAGPRDAVSLQKTWEFATEGYVDAELISDDGLVYVPSWDGTLSAISLNGLLKWQRSLGDTLDASPAVTGDLVLVQTWSREVYALDRLNGQVRWRFDYSPSRADDHRQGGLSVIGEVVLAPAWNGTLYALDRETGARRWGFDGGQPLRSRPAYDGSLLYLASGAGVLSALTPQEGALLWQYDADAPLLSEPAPVPEGVVILDRNGVLTMLDEHGKRQWQSPLDELCYYGAPVYHGGALFVPTAAGALWKIDVKTGRKIWRSETAGPVYATPRLSDGRVYLGDNSGALQVFNAENGQVLTTVRLAREIQGRPLILGNLLIIGSRDHKVHAFTLREEAGL